MREHKADETQGDNRLSTLLEPMVAVFSRAGDANQDELAADAKLLLNFYEEAEDGFKKKLLQTLAKYNADTLGVGGEATPSAPRLVFLKPSGEYSLQVALEYTATPGVDDSLDGVSDADAELGTLIHDPEMELSDGSEGLHFAVFYVWLALCWQDIEGHRCGLVASTLENNSASAFVLNDFAWDELSRWQPHSAAPPKVSEHSFPRRLSPFELFQRVRMVTYPVNPYTNAWRYFERDSDFREIVLYANDTGERSGTRATFGEAGSLVVASHSTLADAMRRVIDRTDDWILEGFFERQRPPGGPLEIYEGAIETQFHSGTSWFQEELSNRLELESVERFEREYSIQLPFHFKHYLRLFNGRQANRYRMRFRLSSGSFLAIKTFHTLDEISRSLEGTHPKPSLLGRWLHRGRQTMVRWLTIGVAEDGALLRLNVDPADEAYGTLGLTAAENDRSSEVDRRLDTSFAEFVGTTEY